MTDTTLRILFTTHSSSESAMFKNAKERIAVDFDGVIALTAASKADWLWRTLGVRIDANSLDRSSVEEMIGSENYLAMQACTGFIDTIDALPMHDALIGLRKIAKRYDVFVVTARHSEKMKWVDMWLARMQMYEFVQGVVSSYARSKIEVAESIGCFALIDNDLRHLLQTSASPVKRLWFGRTGNVHAIDRRFVIDAVEGWREIIERFGVDE